jgi:hypothetical protein
VSSEILESAECAADTYLWSSEVFRKSFIQTIVIRHETIDETTRRWQSLAKTDTDNSSDCDKRCKQEIETIKARFLLVLMDLISGTSPVSENTG